MGYFVGYGYYLIFFFIWLDKNLIWNAIPSSYSFSEALKPMEEQQRLTNERLAKLQHSVEVMSYQQREQVGKMLSC